MHPESSQRYQKDEVDALKQEPSIEVSPSREADPFSEEEKLKRMTILRTIEQTSPGKNYRESLEKRLQRIES